MTKQKCREILFVHTDYSLTAEQAYMAAYLLEQVTRAIWRDYGDDMADFQGRVFPDDPPIRFDCAGCPLFIRK